MTAPLPYRGPTDPTTTPSRFAWLWRLELGLLLQVLGLLLVVNALNANDELGAPHIGVIRFVVGGLMLSLGFLGTALVMAGRLQQGSQG